MDLVTEPIDRIEPEGVVTADGTLHPLDLLVLATGFRPHEWGIANVVSADGRSLKEAWDRIERIEREESRALSPKPAAAEAFQADLREAMKGTVWVTGCKSWYISPDGTPTLWPWSAGHFHQLLRTPDFGDYEFVEAG